MRWDVGRMLRFKEGCWRNPCVCWAVSNVSWQIWVWSRCMHVREKESGVGGVKVRGGAIKLSCYEPDCNHETGCHPAFCACVSKTSCKTFEKCLHSYRRCPSTNYTSTCSVTSNTDLHIYYGKTFPLPAEHWPLCLFGKLFLSEMLNNDNESVGVNI